MVHFCETVTKEISIGSYKVMFKDPKYEYDKVNLASFDWKTIERTVLKGK